MKTGKKQEERSASLLQQVLREAARAPSSEGRPTKLLPWELHSASQHHTARVLTCVYEHWCFLSIYSVHPLARCVLRHQKSLREVILGGLGKLKNFSI